MCKVKRPIEPKLIGFLAISTWPLVLPDQSSHPQDFLYTLHMHAVPRHSAPIRTSGSLLLLLHMKLYILYNYINCIYYILYTIYYI